MLVLFRTTMPSPAIPSLNKKLIHKFSNKRIVQFAPLLKTNWPGFLSSTLPRCGVSGTLQGFQWLDIQPSCLLELKWSHKISICNQTTPFAAPPIVFLGEEFFVTLSISLLVFHTSLSLQKYMFSLDFAWTCATSFESRYNNLQTFVSLSKTITSKSKANSKTMQKPETRQADDSDVFFLNHWTFPTDFGLQKSPPLWAASATCLHPWIECLANRKLTGAMTETTFYPNQFANPSFSNVYKCVVWPARFAKEFSNSHFLSAFFKKCTFWKSLDTSQQLNQQLDDNSRFSRWLRWPSCFFSNSSSVDSSVNIFVHNNFFISKTKIASMHHQCVAIEHFWKQMNRDQ